MTQLRKFIPQKLLFFDLSVAKICSVKIFVREYYGLKVFGVSNEYALNLQGFFNLYFLYFYLPKDYVFVLSRWKKIQMGEEQVVMRINVISQTPTEKYNNLLVYRDDTKLCPKSVQWCEQCRLAFSSLPDLLVVKIVGIRERTEKSGERKNIVEIFTFIYIKNINSVT